jgi:transposase-like protein
MMKVPELLSDPVYHDEDAARAFIEESRWPDHVICPLCGSFDKISKLGGDSMGPGWWYCGSCNDKFTCRVGTVMERSHIALHKWLLAFRLMASSKKGISAHQLHRTLGITYKSAWFLGHRIRECMNEDGEGPIGGEDKIVEADETFIVKHRGRGEWSYSNYEKKWTKTRDRREVIAFALVERGGKARAVPIDSRTIKDLRAKLTAHADKMSVLMTDELQAYRRAGRDFANHETVNHSEEEWTRGPIHTQTVENFFSIFKRGMRGVYQHCSEDHLARYLHEFAFRYSHRAARGIDDPKRTMLAIKGAEGKRLTYRRTNGKAAEAEGTGTVAIGG